MGARCFWSCQLLGSVQFMGSLQVVPDPLPVQVSVAGVTAGGVGWGGGVPLTRS